ncbi:MAG: hypothetical protein JNK82_24350 [Myxococcaceae bacterium]|nr:hypothetical protein [Myxococcaceae bacterium]
MARSILPSASRHAATARPKIHRAERHRANAAVRAMVHDPSAWDDGGDEPDEMQREISMLVSRRRGSDKLNHFERWAVKRTREMPVELRLGHLAALLPPGLTGEHALQHLERRDELVPESHEHVFRRHRWRRPTNGLLERGEAAELLRRVVVAPDGHRLFNHALKYSRVELPPYVRLVQRTRLLHGLHDVLGFLADVCRERDNRPRLVADRFLRAFKATRSPAAAVMATGVVCLTADEYWKLKYGR